MRTIKAGLAYFALVFGAGFMLGVLRVSLLVPRFGERMAELGEMPLMLVVILVSARFVIQRFCVSRAVAPRLGMGLVALGLLLFAEVLLAVILQQRALADYIASRDPVSGSVYLVMLVLFALMPMLVGRTNPVLDRTP